MRHVITKICPSCREEFIRPHWLKSQKYCCIKCFYDSDDCKLLKTAIETKRKNGVSVGKEVSRQRRWQIRKRAEGRCPICGKNSEGHYFCSNHDKEI